jgi:hypothetical protein
VAAGTQDADGQIAQAGHGPGGGTGADLAGVLGEGDIAEVVQCLDAPVPRIQSASRTGWAIAAVRLVAVVIEQGELRALAVDVHADVHTHPGPPSLSSSIPEAQAVGLSRGWGRPT